MLDINLRTHIIAAQLRQCIDLLRSQFHLLVFEQATYQFGARIGGFFTGIGLAYRQQHA
ncbi:hypothetical protein D3C81_2049980 [compost metagenome]